jgi:hypothetical protein
VLHDGAALFASEAGGGRPARVQFRFVMKSRAGNPRFNRDIVILAWQTMATRAVPLAPHASQCGCTARKTVPSPFRLTSTV